MGDKGSLGRLLDALVTEMFNEAESIRLATRAIQRREQGTAAARIVRTNEPLTLCNQGGVEVKVTLTTLHLNEMFYWVSMLPDSGVDALHTRLGIFGTNYLNLVHFPVCPHCQDEETKVYGVVRPDHGVPIPTNLFDPLYLIGSAKGAPPAVELAEELGFRLTEEKFTTDGLRGQEELDELMTLTSRAEGYTPVRYVGDPTLN